MLHVLSILVFLPAIGAALVLLTRGVEAMRWTALGSCAATLALSLTLLGGYKWDKEIQPGDRVWVESQRADGIVRSADPVTRQILVEIPSSRSNLKLAVGDVKAVNVYACSDRGRRSDGRSGFGVVQMVERAPLAPSYHIEYLLGIDGLSMSLVIVIPFIFFLACIASWKMQKDMRGYFTLFLMLETGAMGVLLSMNLLLFYAFLQILILPTCLLLARWGGVRRRMAWQKFLLFLIAASAALLIALVVIGRRAHSLDLVQLARLLPPMIEHGGRLSAAGPYHFFLLFLTFLIMISSAPVHFWLVDVIVEAPTPIAMILAATLPTIGGYGLLRVVFPLFPGVAEHFWMPAAVVGIVSIFYGALCAMAEADFKRMIAYGLISHMGFVTLGVAVITPAALNGVLFALISQSICGAMMLFLAGVLQERAGRRELADLGGLADLMPKYWAFAAVAFFSSLGLPGFCGFIAQSLVLLGSFQAARPDSVLIAGHFGTRRAVYSISVLACIGTVLLGVHLLLAMRRLFFGPPRTGVKAPADVNDREVGILASFTIVVILLGVLPTPLAFIFSDKTVEALISMRRHGAWTGAVERMEGREQQ